MESAQADFDYYERTVKQMYDRYYVKRISASLVALVIILGYSIFMRETLGLNILLAVVLLILVGYLTLKKQKFSEVYHTFLSQNEPELTIQSIEEAEYSYNFKQGDKAIKVNKKGVRNLPSQNKRYTLMVGFSKNFFSAAPLQIVYYDMLELKYEEKFRLSRNGYSRLPRFLRRFTWTNLKASAGNAGSFILGNLFLLFIVYRLIRYILSFLRMLF